MAQELIALYPGTFDPVTMGHLDIIERASQLFSKIYVTILTHPSKQTLFPLEQRLEMLRQTTADLSCAGEIIISSHQGLSVEYCRQIGARAIIRGLRAQMDFEYEFQIAAANQHLDPEIEMLFLMTRQNLAFVSSSTVKEIASYQGKLDGLVPDIVIEALRKRYA